MLPLVVPVVAAIGKTTGGLILKGLGILAVTYLGSKTIDKMDNVDVTAKYGRASLSISGKKNQKKFW